MESSVGLRREAHPISVTIKSGEVIVRVDSSGESSETNELRLIPHHAHPGRDIDPYLGPSCRRGGLYRAAMRPALEDIENVVGDEAASHGQNVAVAMPMLMAAEQAHRLDQVQMLPGAGHRHVEEAALLSNCSLLPTTISDGMHPETTQRTSGRLLSVHRLHANMERQAQRL